jgi:hypothetical protein
VDDTMGRLVPTTEAAIAGAGSDPAEHLQAAVAAHVRVRIEFQRESFVENSELRSLTSTAGDVSTASDTTSGRSSMQLSGLGRKRNR